jgi:hypothetical protein
MRWVSVGIFSVLLLFCFVIFFPSLNYLQPVARLRAAARRTRVVREQDVRVWIVKRSGFYYCSDSKIFGKLRPGAYMRQSEALQRGYQPFLGSACR